jgi:uncharacterized protein YukE
MSGENSGALAFDDGELARVRQQLDAAKEMIVSLNKLYQGQVDHLYTMWHGPAQKQHADANALLKKQIDDLAQVVDHFSGTTAQVANNFNATEEDNRALFRTA